MKILHTADWHLGKRLESFSRLEEQKLVMQEIVDIADQEQVDLVIIAGDLFDTFNPPIEAEELFYRTLRKLSHSGNRPVIALAGNHDSPDRIQAPDPLAKDLGIFFLGYPDSHIPPFTMDSGVAITQSAPGFMELKIPSIDYPVRIIATPYANEYRLKEFLGVEDDEQALRDVLQHKWQELAQRFCDEQGVNVLATHLFVMKEGQPVPAEPDDEKPILHVGGAQAIFTSNIPPQMQYTALGHLHRRHHTDVREKNVWYSGSPVSYSFAESNQQKYVNIVEIEPGKAASTSAVELQHGKKLLRKRCETMEEAIRWLQDHQEALVELTLVADNFLTAADRKLLLATHSGIITIIPEVKNKRQLQNQKNIDLQQSVSGLFEQYFEHQHQQKPNDEIMDLFNELQAEKGKA